MVRGVGSLPASAGPILLRRLTPQDLAAFQAYRNDPEVGRYQGWLPMTDDEALNFLRDVESAPLLRPGTWSQIAIASVDTRTLLGDLGIFIDANEQQAEIGFTLARAHQGRGLATVAVRTACAWIFEATTVARIIGITDARNAASIRLLQRVGMQFIGSAELEFRGVPCVEHTYALPRR